MVVETVLLAAMEVPAVVVELTVQAGVLEQQGKDLLGVLDSLAALEQVAVVVELLQSVLTETHLVQQVAMVELDTHSH